MVMLLAFFNCMISLGLVSVCIFTIVWSALGSPPKESERIVFVYIFTTLGGEK